MDKSKNQNLISLLSVWGDPESKASATEINTPALADYYEKQGASPAYLALTVLEEILPLQLREIAKEEGASPETALSVFTQKLADRLGLSATEEDRPRTPLFTETLQSQGTPLVGLFMDDNGHLGVMVNPDIGSVLYGKDVSGSQAAISKLGIETLMIAASMLAGDQIIVGEDAADVIEHLIGWLSTGLQSQIPDLSVEFNNLDALAAGTSHLNNDDGKKTMPS